MRLRHLDIRGFGRLRGRIDLDGENAPGVGLVLERNEAGKSTLAAALLAALYGLDGDRRRFRGTITDLDRYRPWTEGPYGLSLTLERHGETLTIDRDFARDTVRVLRGAEDVTDRYRQGHEVAVGEGLTGLRREQFTASVFVGQGDVVWSDPERLTEALQRVADSQSGTSTAATATAALDQALEKYRGVTIGQGKVSTEIKRCEERLAAARDELSALEAQHAALSGSIDALERLRQEDDAATRERRTLRARRLVTEREALDGLLEHDDDLAAQIDRHRREVDGWAGVDERIADSRARIDGLRRRLEDAARDAETARAQARAAEETVEALDADVDRLGLSEIPDDDAFDRLHDAVRRLKDAVTEHEDYLRRLDEDRRALEDLGHGLPQALSLARDFEDLTDADRVRLVGRPGRRGERDERRRDLESTRARARRELEAIAASQDMRRRNGWILLGVALVLALAVFVVGDTAPVPRLAQLALPAALAVAGLVLSLTANGHRSGEHGRALAQIESVAHDLRAVDDEEAADEDDWRAMADRLGIDPERIEERYAAWSRVESLARSASVHRARADEWREARTRALEICAGFEPLFSEPASEPRLDAWIDRARRARELDTRRAAAGDEAAGHRARLQGIEADAGVAEQELRTALAALDLDGAHDDTPLERVLADFDALVESSRARRETREHRIPSLERQRLDDERRAAHRARREAIVAELKALDVDADTEPLSQTDHEDAVARLDEEAAARRRERDRLRAETQHVLRDHERRAPALRAEIEELERARRRAVEFEAAITLARDTLSTLGQETHRVWANALQRSASEFLERMGSDVSEIRFDEDLGLQLRQHGRVITGSEAARILSAGALDAVFLAARFAVARFLGGDDDPLPLVLDDPLANADDRRLLDTLRLLIDAVAPQQQVLLMACQHSRYEWAAGALDRDGALRRLELATD